MSDVDIRLDGLSALLATLAADAALLLGFAVCAVLLRKWQTAMKQGRVGGVA